MRRAFALALLAATSLTCPAAAQTTPEAPPAAVVVAPASAEAFAAARDRVIATMEAITQVEGTSPALAVVMVRRGEAPVVWVHGPLDATANPMVAANADTPFYIASQTKAFVGLMALRLHARGVFSLDQSLADVWPDLTLPEGADPHAITFRQLLSHQGVVENETLEYRTAYTDAVPSRDYPAILAAYSSARAPGFDYANLGYLIYGAALETRTGRDWRDWLDAEVLRPAGLTHTGARASLFRASELPLYHQWLGGSDWSTYPTKDDDVMHAAGGLVISPNDMARWLQVQLEEAPSVASADILAQSHTQQIAADIRGDVLPCQGYAIGWNICRLGAVDVRLHGGAYTAVRSSMAVSPELGVGFAFFSNSDSLTGALSQFTAQIFFETIQNPSWGGQSPEALQTQLGARLPRLVENRRNEVAERRAEAQWEGWAWRPTRAQLRSYVGRYHSDRLGNLRIVMRDGVLHAELGALQTPLEPAKADLFGFSSGPLDPPAPVRFERTGRRAVAVTWNDERFTRVR
jgi:CubicO group peptidase (beta-lactamase class C family)